MHITEVLLTRTHVREQQKEHGRHTLTFLCLTVGGTPRYYTQDDGDGGGGGHSRSKRSRRERAWEAPPHASHG